MRRGQAKQKDDGAIPSKKAGSELEELERQIVAEMYRTYSKQAIDHAMKPRNIGRMEDADGFARITGPCGDTMEIYLRIEGGRVADARSGLMVAEQQLSPAVLRLNWQRAKPQLKLTRLTLNVCSTLQVDCLNLTYIAPF